MLLPLLSTLYFSLIESSYSTNGTWYRLSGPHQESPFHEIKAGMEVLVGTVRFAISDSMTISEIERTHEAPVQAVYTTNANAEDKIRGMHVEVSGSGARDEKK